MKYALSTNWCNRRIESGEEIADLAMELGFDALELGFHTTQFQVKGFKSRLDRMPVGSVHAFCPVPISAPQGYPELYTLATTDADARAIAKFHITRNIEFAAEMGADALVLHAGRVGFSTFWHSDRDSVSMRRILEENGGDLASPKYVRELAKCRALRHARGAKLLDVFVRELEALIPALERNRITLALENLPYLEGFPDESEMAELRERLSGAPVASWFDTGHDLVRRNHGWLGDVPAFTGAVGMHLNDIRDFYDDHLAPGDGAVDFAGLAEVAGKVRHVVFEPNSGVRSERLRESLANMRRLWG